jgi:hypothetical protein
MQALALGLPSRNDRFEKGLRDAALLIDRTELSSGLPRRYGNARIFFYRALRGQEDASRSLSQCELCGVSGTARELRIPHKPRVKAAEPLRKKA